MSIFFQSIQIIREGNVYFLIYLSILVLMLDRFVWEIHCFISTYNAHKIFWDMPNSLFKLSPKICVYFAYMTLLKLEQTTFQELNRHLWSVASILDSISPGEKINSKQEIRTAQML